MAKKIRKNNNMKGKLIILIFLIWLVLGVSLIAKLMKPIMDYIVVKDNYVYAMESCNPNNYSEKDKTFSEYKDVANSYINSSDKVVSTFFRANAIVKVFVLIFAVAPEFIIFALIVEILDRISTRKHKKVRA